MSAKTLRPARRLPDGTLLQNRLLAALPAGAYTRVVKHVRMRNVALGETLHAHHARIAHVYFPNGGMYSVTNEMRDGSLVEVATVGSEGMLGVGVFLGDPDATGRTMQQVSNGSLPSLAVAQFLKETAAAGPFRDAVGLYAQATTLQTMQGAACNALHGLTQRCCRWLLQTQDRVESDEFHIKQEFLAMMLGVHRPTVTVVLRDLRDAGMVSSTYGRMRILNRKKLERTSCECYEVVRAHYERLGL